MIWVKEKSFAKRPEFCMWSSMYKKNVIATIKEVNSNAVEFVWLVVARGCNCTESYVSLGLASWRADATTDALCQNGFFLAQF